MFLATAHQASLKESDETSHDAHEISIEEYIEEDYDDGDYYDEYDDDYDEYYDEIEEDYEDNEDNIYSNWRQIWFQ